MTPGIGEAYSTPLGVAFGRSIWQAKSFINRLIPHKNRCAIFIAPKGDGLP